MDWNRFLTAGLLSVSALAASVADRRLGAASKDGATIHDQGWRLGEPVRYENLTVFPVLGKTGADTAGFLTLDEAMASGQVLVTEQNDQVLRRSRDGRPIPVPAGYGSAQVNQLVLVNRGNKPLLLLAGEVVSGGKQDRIIAKDRIVAPGAEPLPLDVFCVEHGRWTGGLAFAQSKMIVHPSVREKAAVDHSQNEVWAAVAQGSTARPAAGALPAAPTVLSPRTLSSIASSEAPTGSYAKLYGSSRVSGSVESFADELHQRFARATAAQKHELIGVVVAYGGEVAWSDVFASPSLFERYWPKLLRSYVIEALARPASQEHASSDDARAFLQLVSGLEKAESEPGVYRWTEIVQGRYAQIELEALSPKQLMLHWVKIHRTS